MYDYEWNRIVWSGWLAGADSTDGWMDEFYVFTTANVQNIDSSLFPKIAAHKWKVQTNVAVTNDEDESDSSNGIILRLGATFPGKFIGWLHAFPIVPVADTAV